MIWMILSSLLFSIGGLWFYLYYWRQGQFEDDESVKYQLFREDNPEN